MSDDLRVKDETEFKEWFATQKYSLGNIPTWNQVDEMRRVWCIARQTLREQQQEAVNES